MGRAVGAALRQPLGHHQFGAAPTGPQDVELVHKGPHEEDATSGGLEQIFLGQRVRNVFQSKTAPLVENPNDEPVGVHFKNEADQFLVAFLVAVVKCVGDALAGGQGNLC